MKRIRNKKEPLNSIFIRKYKDAIGLERFNENSLSALFSKDGRKILFIHNPKVAGSSLKDYLKVNGQTHAHARHICNEKTWHSSYIIGAIRHPIHRFISSYKYHILSDYDGGMIKNYGGNFKKLNALEYFYLIKNHPRNSASNYDFMHYPSKSKPFPDLILRYEDIENWNLILKENIKNISGKLPHENKSNISSSNDNFISEFYKISRITNKDSFNLLMDKLWIFYKKDSIFGYDKLKFHHV